jgi:hypothetical protein
VDRQQQRARGFIVAPVLTATFLLAARHHGRHGWSRRMWATQRCRPMRPN